MSEPRFTVKWYCPHSGRLAGHEPGYVVFDRDRRITIAWQNYAEAREHCDNIHRIYLRYGW